MTRYIPSPSAAELTTALWDLARPVRGKDDTQGMFGWVDDLQNPAHRWLEVDTAFEIVVDANATLGRLAGILQPYVSGGFLPPDTLEKLSASIEAHRGQRVAVYALFPPFFQSASKSPEQMIELGYLPPIESFTP